MYIQRRMDVSLMQIVSQKGIRYYIQSYPATQLMGQFILLAPELGTEVQGHNLEKEDFFFWSERKPRSNSCSAAIPLAPTFLSSSPSSTLTHRIYGSSGFPQDPWFHLTLHISCANNLTQSDNPPSEKQVRVMYHSAVWLKNTLQSTPQSCSTSAAVNPGIM